MPTPHLEIELSEFAVQYNRMPFGFGHNLHKLDLFSDVSLCKLCDAYAYHPHDYFVSESAPEPGRNSIQSRNRVFNRTRPLTG